MASLVALAGLTKRFGSVRAVADVSLGFEAGAIHAVVGENGAGKSTLLKMAAGVLVPDAGEVLVDGQRLRPHSAREAIRRGVGMVQQ
ncbi:MAG TPA: ATP-binding cassette domain-containing protein, partial [Polyangiaceae bacterium]|nr:ATP-binding cassette domain-containing protein [Polyangiaceae bacterium]